MRTAAPGRAAALAAAAAVTALAVMPAVMLATAVAVPAAAAAEPQQPWTWPLDGAGPAAVVRVFDPPETRYSAGHRGVDLAGAPGTAVRAAGDGRVSFAGLLAGRGVLVVVHGELRTTYEPVVAAVGVGARVVAGQVVGTLSPGHAGCPAPACLHWGLKRGDDYLDPLRLLSPGPVRLLPVARGSPPVDDSRPAATAHVPAPAPAAPPGDPPQGEPPLRRTSAASGAGPAGAAGPAAVLGLVLLLALLLRAAHGPRPRPGGTAAAPARAGAPARPGTSAQPGATGPDELGTRRALRGRPSGEPGAGRDAAA